jgi:hypothetical protein
MEVFMALITCPECNTEVSDRAEKCIKCGFPLTTATPHGEKEVVTAKSAGNTSSDMTDSEREELFGKVSDKWIWTLLGVFVGVSILEFFVDGWWPTILAIVLNIFFWRLDISELKAKGYSGGWMFFGLLVPIYLFIRAVKTNKKYVCAIIYCVVFLFFILSPLLIGAGQIGGAGHWKKEPIKNEWGEVSGYFLIQTAKGEGMLGNDPWNWEEIGIGFYGGNIVMVTVPGSIGIGYMKDGSKIYATLRDESGAETLFEGVYSKELDNAFGVNLLFDNIKLVQALQKKTNYKILVKWEGGHISANIKGSLPIESNRASVANAQTSTTNAPTQQKSMESVQSSVPAPTKNAKSPADFVPTEYKILKEVKGDLNKDDLEDYVLVIAGKQDKSDCGIIIAFNKGGDYENVLENRNIFSYEDNGDEAFNPSVEVAIKKGILGIEWYYMQVRPYYGHLSYKFRFQNSDFELIGYDESHSYGPNTLSAKSINFLSNKMQTKENKDDDGNSEEFNETWNDIVIKEPIKLRKIAGFDGFNVMKYITVK